MTKAELPLFRTIGRTLATRLRVAAPPSDDDLRALFLALEDIPLALLDAAAERLFKLGPGFWPRPKEWREAVDAIQEARYEAGMLRPSAQDLPDVCCDECDDTGWRPCECAGLGRLAGARGPSAEPCDRTTTHPPHRYVRLCACRVGNPRYQAHHPRPPAKYAEAD